MGINPATISAATRARMGLAIPTKPARAQRGTGTHATRKANVLAQLRHPRIHGDTTVTAELVGLRVHNPLNGREHWRVVAKRAKTEKALTRAVLLNLVLPELPVVVTLTRMGKRLFDIEAVGASLKHVKDAVADAYGLDDADQRIEWRFEQAVAGVYGVKLKVAGRAGSAADPACTSGPSSTKPEKGKVGE